MDNIAVPGHVKIAAGFGPKFIYPTTPKMRPRDTIGVITAIQQITGCVSNTDSDLKSAHNCSSVYAISSGKPIKNRHFESATQSRAS